MRRLVLLYAALVGVMLALFVVAEALHVPYLTDQSPLRGHNGFLAATVGVTLLVVDVVLPVPSSLVMVAHGALFGVAGGTALSMLGSLGAFGVAFALGRRGAPVVARVVSEEGRMRADQLLVRWGVVAILLTRPLPILAETVAFAAGASPVRWRGAITAATFGYLPPAVAYAMAGTAAGPLSDGALIVLAVGALGLAAVAAARAGRPVQVG
jgi:uncharacterized membrane protein YdjX (TVP38/TMEM64 family)